MIQVVVLTATSRDTKVVSTDTTIKAVLESVGADIASGGYSLDGSTLLTGEINKTFASFGVAEDSKVYLSKIKAQNNA